MPEVTEFNGVPLSTHYLKVGFPYGSDGPYVSSPSIRPRINTVGVQEYVTYGERTIPFIVTPYGTPSDAEFIANGYRYLSPFGGLRTIKATHDDGSTPIYLDVDITSLQKVSNRHFSGTMVAPNPIWRGESESTDTTSTTTVSGTYKAIPRVSITPTATTLARRRVTISDNTGRGLSSYPVLITLDTQGYSATTAANYIAFINGRSVPLSVTAPNDASTKIWLRINIPPSGSSYVDIYYGSSVSNAENTSNYQAGGLSLSSSSNSSWVWNDYSISTFPTATGVWRPGKLGLSQDNVTYGIQTESSSSITFFTVDSGSGGNDADCMILVVGCKASGTLTGLSRHLQLFSSDGLLRAFCKYRKANQVIWTDTEIGGGIIDSTIGTYDLDGHDNGTVSTGITVTDAVEIAIGIEPYETAPRGTLILSGDITLALSGYPTVSVGVAITARLIDGTLTNTTNNDAITFDQLYMDNTTLTVDCLDRSIITSTGPFYGGIQFSDPADWFALNVGANAWSWSSGSYTTELAWFTRYLI